MKDLQRSKTSIEAFLPASSHIYMTVCEKWKVAITRKEVIYD